MVLLGVEEIWDQGPHTSKENFLWSPVQVYQKYLFRVIITAMEESVKVTDDSSLTYQIEINDFSHKLSKGRLTK